MHVTARQATKRDARSSSIHGSSRIVRHAATTPACGWSRIVVRGCEPTGDIVPHTPAQTDAPPSRVRLLNAISVAPSRAVDQARRISAAASRRANPSDFEHQVRLPGNRT